MLWAISINNGFLTWPLIGLRLCCWPIRSQIWNFMLINIGFNMEISLWYRPGKNGWRDDVIKWNHLPRYWPFVREFTGHRWIPLTKWRGALMFSLICAWINGWVNNREAGDLRRHCAPYDVTVMRKTFGYKSWMSELCGQLSEALLLKIDVSWMQIYIDLLGWTKFSLR